MLPENEYSEFESRQYINPQTGVDETNAFIENLRATQQANNAQIAKQTQALGTDISSNLGGLIGGEGYWTSRYQTPQTNSAVANLRAAAQATALNEALANEKAAWDKRYQDAYRAYQKRQYAKANTPTTTNPYTMVEGDEPDTQTTTPSGGAKTYVSGVSGAYTVVGPDGILHIVDMNTKDESTLLPGEQTLDRTSASSAVGNGTIRVLPNGNRVLVKPGYELTKENGKYYLVNISNGNKTEVGGY